MGRGADEGGGGSRGETPRDGVEAEKVRPFLSVSPREPHDVSDLFRSARRAEGVHSQNLFPVSTVFSILPRPLNLSLYYHPHHHYINDQLVSYFSASAALAIDRLVVFDSRHSCSSTFFQTSKPSSVFFFDSAKLRRRP